MPDSIPDGGRSVEHGWECLCVWGHLRPLAARMPVSADQSRSHNLMPARNVDNLRSLTLP